MQIQRLLIALSLILSGMLYAAAEPMKPQEPAEQLQNIELLPAPALDELIHSVSYESLSGLAKTSITLRKRLAEKRFVELLPSKLIEYWAQPLIFTEMKPEVPSHKGKILETQFYASYQSAAFSPTGLYIATGNPDSQFLLWKLQAKKLALGEAHPYYHREAVTLKNLALSGIEAANRVNYSHSVAFSPDEKLVAGAVYKNIFVWEIPSGMLKFEFEDNSIIDAVAFSPLKQQLAYHAYNKIKIIDLKTKKIVKELNAGRNPLLAFSPDGTMLATSSADEIVVIWHIKDKTFKQIKELGRRSDLLSSIAFSPDSTMFAVGYTDGIITLWNIQTGKITKEWSANSPVNFLAFSRHGAVLASASEKDDVIKLWNAGTGELITKREGNGPIAFSPNGLILVACGKNGRMRLWQKERILESLY